jgi:Ca-activated chloride channel family protein
MQTSTRISTSFDSHDNTHDVRLLIDIRGDTPIARPPINVALVLDRSGSMNGRPLAAAKTAAKHFASFLGANDRISVVAFDTVVETIAGPTHGGAPEVHSMIERLTARDMTNLSAGWLTGVNQVRGGIVTGTNRVVLFTDGEANRGIIDVAELARMSGASAADGVSTTCIGFGADFNEDLLEAMARAGRGHYWYVENANQMLDIFASEIQNLVAHAARNVELEFSTLRCDFPHIEWLNDYPVTATRAGTWRVQLGDLYATSPRELAMHFRATGAVANEPIEIARVVLKGDIVTANGTEHRSVELPVNAMLDGADHIDSGVELAFLHLRLAKSREDAMRRVDNGDFDTAVFILRDAMAFCEPYANEPAVVNEIRDLESQAGQVALRQVTSADRKYNKARAAAVKESRYGFAETLRRK